ncbi:Mbeg1-like protein [Fusobacterium mortiferum]|uniref:Mbeg1-like protein n=1 Tax=Fusobacterium mortiferum TaxID=850 RepID=UPI003F8EDF3F
MIKDAEYAFFSQLSYLNWNNLDMNELKTYEEYNTKDFIKFLGFKDLVWNKIKINNIEPRVENGILMYDEVDKRLFGVFGIERDTANSKLMKPYYDFKGWQFIYSADKAKLYRDKYKFEDMEDDGFYAVAFMKENDIVIAYRGTEPDKIEDLIADLYIGFLNRNHSQLVSAYLFVEYIKELYPNKNIHLTGHSLGGCLAQYAFVCTNKKYPTVTWNALGLGKHKNTITDGIFWGNDITDYIGLYSLELQDKLEEEVLDKNGNIKNEIILLTEKENIDSIFNILNPRVTEIYEKGEYIVGKKGFFSLKFVDSNYVGKDKEERNILTKKQKEKLEEELRIKSIQIYWLLRGIKNYQLCFKATSNKIKNYYNSKDWTALLQTREGETVDVLTGDICEQEKTDDTKIKIAKQTLDKSGFNYHGVNDFLLYMNKEGMIEPGKYNEIFTKNLIKTIYEHVKPTNNSLKLKIFKENSEKYTDKENPFQKFHILATKKRTFLNNMTLVEEANIKYFVPAINSISSDINEYISYIPFLLKPEENDEIGVYIVGQLSNVTLAGIKGGVESQLIKVFSKKEIINEEKYLKLENKYINLVKKSYGINN